MEFPSTLAEFYFKHEGIYTFTMETLFGAKFYETDPSLVDNLKVAEIKIRPAFSY